MFESPLINTLLVAMTPVGELRVALPLAMVYYKMPFAVAFPLVVVGNMLPVVGIVYLLEPVSTFLSKHSRLMERFFEWLFNHTRKRHSHRFETGRDIALVTFVAIPLPVTGAWSGALAAFVFGIPPRRSIPLILLGVIGAGIIVTILVLTGTAFL